MKIQSKKKFIAFSLVVILATIFSLTWIQGNKVSAATVGDKIYEPEDGWKRIDDINTSFQHTGSWQTLTNRDDYYHGTVHYVGSGAVSSKFNFTGTKLRIIGKKRSISSTSIEIKIDGVSETYSAKTDKSDASYTILYEKNQLSNGEHTVEMVKADQGYFDFDAIDIDANGEIKPYNPNPTTSILVSSITLNKNTLDLNVGDSETLTATVLPEDSTNKAITWSSSDESIAAVDENGKVTAIKAGNVTITAKTTDGSNLTATCNVTVVQPSNDRAILAITMTNGQTKEYDLPNSEIEAFTNWFDSSNGKGQPKFGFNKKIQPYKEVKEYVVFDKISSYEVRTYTVIN